MVYVLLLFGTMKRNIPRIQISNQISNQISKRSIISSLQIIFCYSLLVSVMSYQVKASPIVVFPTCNHRESDGADVGQHSNLCDADIFGNSILAESLYGDLIYSRNEMKETEKPKYVTELYAFVKASATQFILKIEKNASKERVQRFTDDIMTIAYHESRFTHYAYGKDGRFKLMAADNRLVSRGLMQINQSFHASRSRDNSLDIFGNLNLGMELIYSNQKYIDESIDNGTMTCITKQEKQSKEYLDLRLRAAWSAYNSGSYFCRFRKNDQWSMNDKMFLQDITKAEWRKLISNENLQTKVDINCLGNGDEFCHLPTPQNAHIQQDSEKVLIYNDGSSCIVDQSSAKKPSIICAGSLRLSQCFGVKSSAIKINMGSSATNTFMKNAFANARIFVDREELCSLRVPELVKVGEFFKLKKAVNMYDEIDGKVLATLKPSGQIYQVIDYTIKGQASFERYYKIASSRGHYGFINGGNQKDLQSVVEKVDAPAASTILSIPVASTKLVVTIQTGLKVFAEPNENKHIGNIIPNTHFVAQRVLIKGNENQIFVEINSDIGTAYVYVGRTYPKNTLNQFVRIE